MIYAYRNDNSGITIATQEILEGLKFPRMCWYTLYSLTHYCSWVITCPTTPASHGNMETKQFTELWSSNRPLQFCTHESNEVWTAGSIQH
jgi:hypothetical protein